MGREARRSPATTGPRVRMRAPTRAEAVGARTRVRRGTMDVARGGRMRATLLREYNQRTDLTGPPSRRYDPCVKHDNGTRRIHPPNLPDPLQTPTIASGHSAPYLDSLAGALVPFAAASPDPPPSLPFPFSSAREPSLPSAPSFFPFASPCPGVFFSRCPSLRLFRGA